MAGRIRNNMDFVVFFVTGFDAIRPCTLVRDSVFLYRGKSGRLVHTLVTTADSQLDGSVHNRLCVYRQDEVCLFLTKTRAGQALVK